MSNVKCAAIGKYTRAPADKLRQAERLPRRREGAMTWLGAAGMFALYFAVLVWAIMGAVR